MPISAGPFGTLRTKTVRGSRMAYIDEGEGEAIVLSARHPTSSYLSSNVMPNCEGLARRVVARDLLGMGRFDELHDSGRTGTGMPSNVTICSSFGTSSRWEAGSSSCCTIWALRWASTGRLEILSACRHLLHGSARHADHPERVGRTRSRPDPGDPFAIRRCAGPEAEPLHRTVPCRVESVARYPSPRRTPTGRRFCVRARHDAQH